ncbi:longitudinals lacking protein, isoforms H/M/V isoform X6 [Nasonia vitripennis]|uniref:BTB domain-containing protein n=1 Tax=Nasonia vitripennis TaxID=7425 RepID=A0A7M7QXW4_NASVI|nr:longitudinals lacking protein, isoforms H/M/V isoform X6 [Nasonia vitripennis]XP_032456421.1 longitudinals lacking protein, isoforms H/M/V isoform X6 [Nasonia vitripennis]
MEDDQQFCLRWNNHQSTIIQNFDTLLESGTLVDCTLAAEGKYLKAHKVVLSACSPYFEGLLSEHYDKHPVFILKDVKFKELKAMMDYMYRGEVNISQDQLTALLKAAESLQIKGLSDSRTDKGTGNTGNTTTGGSKDNTRPAKTASSTAAASASAAAVDIPHTSSGLTIEKNSKVPRQSIQQVSVSDQLENSASPQLRGHSSREGSQSPTRKRKRLRRRSLGNDDNSMENHEASNSSDVNMTAPALGVAPVAEEKSQADPADSIGRSALMQQLTKPADEMLQMPLEKPEPSEDMIQPKSEYQDDQESVEDLTNFDDDMNDLNEMEQDNSRAGPSHDPSQHAGMPSWHIAGDRSNASVVGAAAGPGAGDEVFLAAAEAAQAQRDSQDIQIDEIKQELIDLTSDVPEINVQSLDPSPEISLIKIQKQANDLPVIESVYTLGSPATSQAHQMNVDTNALTTIQDKKSNQGFVYILQQIPDPKTIQPSQHVEITGNQGERLDHINSILGKSAGNIKVKTRKKKVTSILKSKLQKKTSNFELAAQHQPVPIVVEQQACSTKASSSQNAATKQTNPTLQITNDKIFYPATSQMPIFILSQPSPTLPQPNAAFSQPSTILTPTNTVFSQSNPISSPVKTSSSQSSTVEPTPETNLSQPSTSTSTSESQLRKILMQPRVKISLKPNTTAPPTITTSSQPNIVRSFAVDLNSLVFNLRQDGRLGEQDQSSSKDSSPAEKN